MTLLKTLAFGLLFLLLTTACQDDVHIGRPLLSFDFNNNVHNQGLAKVAVFGPQVQGYHYEKRDTSLDFSLHSISRQPLSVKFKDLFSLEDYDGFTIAIRVKKHIGDNEAYTILSQESQDSLGLNGWQIMTQENGAWGWQLSDGISQWTYYPTEKQTINDGNWHHLVFSYDSNKQEARLYYDGKNVAIYSVWENQMLLDGIPLTIGISSDSVLATKDLFNGQVDDLAMWSRPLKSYEIEALYREKGDKSISQVELDEQLTVMTWNIWDGGVNDGKHVGIKRVIDVIEGASPDVVVLQEVNGSGPVIADALDYTLYYRSEGINLLTRYPMGESHNLYRSETIGCVELILNANESVLTCPVFLNDMPQLDDYIKSGEAVEDSILILEESTRGKEIRFILSELSQLSLRANKTPIVLAGDFNSGSHLDWTVKNISNNRNLKVMYPVTKKLETKGFVDSYRALYPDETKDVGKTWSLRSSEVIANRIDYIFYKGKKLRPINSFLIDDHPLGFPSDHAALVSTFQWVAE